MTEIEACLYGLAAAAKGALRLSAAGFLPVAMQRIVVPERACALRRMGQRRICLTFDTSVQRSL